MIVLIVHMTVKSGLEQEAAQVLREMTEETRKEPGCIQYVAHQSTEHSQRFAFYEVYTDQAALDAHRASTHYKELVKGKLDVLCAERTRELFVPLS